MFRAVADGRIKAIWIMGTNPVVSMPDAHFIEAALKACPFVVVSDVVAETDTLRCAHVKLPAAAWGEKDGTVTNSERRISRQRRFLPLPGAARPDWWIICEVAQRMGFVEAFSFKSAAEIFAEHAALSAFENDGARDFDIGAFADIDAAQFDGMAPFQWPRQTESAPPETRFFADGRFYTPDRKGRFIAVTPRVERRTNSKFPFVLNTGRVRDHWHTMTRTAKSQRLSQHSRGAFRRNPSARCGETRHSRCGCRAYFIGGSFCARTRASVEAAGARRCLCPNALERSIRVPSARR